MSVLISYHQDTEVFILFEQACEVVGKTDCLGLAENINKNDTILWNLGVFPVDNS